MTGVLISLAVGFALMNGLFEVPPQMRELWEKQQSVSKTKSEEEKALEFVNRFEASYKAESDCIKPGTELKRLECKNRRDMAFKSYVRLNWKPN